MNQIADPYQNFARKALGEGDLEKARRMLQALLRQDPRVAENWFLLSAAVEETRETVTCLRNALTVDAAHAGALKLLEDLRQQHPDAVGEIQQLGPDSSALGRSCAFCLAVMQEGNRVVRCPRCGASHHMECWHDGGWGCHVRFCDGFTLCESAADPVATQSPPEPRPLIVIRKEDLSKTVSPSRKEREQRFQLRLLQMRLLAEADEGYQPPIKDLPPLDELLDQLMRDRKPAALAPATRTAEQGEPRATWPYLATPVVVGVVPIWSARAELNDAASPILQEAANLPTCAACGEGLATMDARFCHRCGADQ